MNSVRWWLERGQRALAPVLRAYAALVFSRDPRAGLLLAAASFSHAPRGLLGLVGLVSAQAFARALAYRNDLVANGYFAFNSLLVGLALSHGATPTAQLLIAVVLAALLTTLLTAVLGDFLSKRGLPVLALPFVLVASALSQTTLSAQDYPPWLSYTTDLPARQSAFPMDALDALGAITFAPNRVAGALVLAAVLLSSRIAALTLVAGTLLGVGVARLFAVQDPAIVVATSYNAGLTALALGAVLFAPSRASLALATLGSAGSAWLALALLLPFAPVSLPVLAWPFTLMTLFVARACMLRPAGLPPFPAPLPGASPETNLFHAEATRLRLRLPGPPRLLLPVACEWVVTQGFSGAITHREAWSHALDFEVFDAAGFPFRDEGRKLEDYYCFGQPVFAPGAGAVVFVQDGLEDNAPGTLDTAHPFGNAVVIQHSAGLYSVVAHLRLGSIRVRVGDQVSALQLVAECGSSGRSPRPHLHLQLQPSPILGAPTLDFLLSHYCVTDTSGVRFERLGIPREGQRIHRPERDPLLSSLCRMAPGQELSLRSSTGEETRLRVDLSLYGEHSLYDVGRRERLYFVPEPGGLTFTALHGSSHGPLGVLFRCLPHLPAIRVERACFEEELPPSAFLPAALRAAYSWLSLVFAPLRARAVLRMSRHAGHTQILSESTLSLFGHVLRRGHARIEFAQRGLCPLATSTNPTRTSITLSRLRNSSSVEAVVEQNHATAK